MCIYTTILIACVGTYVVHVLHDNVLDHVLHVIATGPCRLLLFCGSRCIASNTQTVQLHPRRVCWWGEQKADGSVCDRRRHTGSGHGSSWSGMANVPLCVPSIITLNMHACHLVVSWHGYTTGVQWNKQCM